MFVVDLLFCEWKIGLKHAVTDHRACHHLGSNPHSRLLFFRSYNYVSIGIDSILYIWPPDC